MRILAIDYGIKHTGFALGEDGFTMPLDQISTSSIQTVIDKVKKIIESENISKIIVGLPVVMNNLKIQKIIKDFLAELREQVNLEIELVEEDFTSKEAFEENFEKFADLKHLKKTIHKNSAEKILINYYLKVD